MTTHKSDTKAPHKHDTKLAQGTKGLDNGKPNEGNSGLDRQGQMRIGERITIAARGAGLVLTQSHSGREVEITEAELSGLLDREYFVEKRG